MRIKGLAALAGVALSAASFGQGTIIYQSVRQIQDQGIILQHWGSGTIAQTDEVAYDGTNSLRVTTRNYFQGGFMRLGNPVDLTSAAQDKNNLLQFMVFVSDASTTMGPGGGPGGAPGKGGGLGSGAGAAGGDSGGGLAPPGQGGPGRPPMGGGGSHAAATAPLRTIRIIVTTTDGKRSEAYIPIGTSSAGQKGWRPVAIPLQAINGFDRTNRIIKEIGFSGDAASSFYVGDIRIINDTTPISGDVNVRTLNLALGDEVEFRASGFGGASVLVYQWDFDAKDGIQVDAEGQVVRRRFRKPGEWTITLTIADKNGLKKPYTTTIQARVNP